MNDIQKIADRLTNEFKLSYITLHGNSPSNSYIRYGYWKPLPLEVIEKLSELTEHEIYDEDCGYLFSYLLC